MSLLFDLDEPSGGGGDDVVRAQRLLDDAQADMWMDRAIGHAKAVGGSDGIERLQRYRRQIASVEAEILAEEVHDDGDTRRAERMLADGKTSRAEQRKKAQRAKAVSKNSELAAKLASDDLSEEQLDVIADASDKTDGEAATDSALIDEIASVPPEQGRKLANEYVADRATRDGVQTEHDRQRALCRASKFRSKAKGLDCIGAEGDGVSNKLAWDEIEKRANEIYLRDGGRELPAAQHPRTREQRLYDAFIELITGQTVTPNGQTIPNTQTIPNNHTDTDDDETADETSPKKRSKRHTPKQTPARPQIVIGLTLDHVTGQDPAAIATQIGLGLIPESVLAGYAAHADILAALYDRNGQALWLGRLKRYSTPHQMVALILRDNGCVLCGADHTKCQAHHAMPSNAPGKGRTDLDNLVLLCGPCHTRLHAEEQTIYQDNKGTWRTRPATPDETPPPRPNTTRNTIRRE